MTKKIRDITTVLFAAVIIFGLFVWGLVKPDSDVSQSERRPLAKMPELTFKNIIDGKFTSEFETYATDQFPARDTFRGIKTFFAYDLFLNRDVNGMYCSEDGYLTKIEASLDDDAYKKLELAAKKFNEIYERDLKDKANNVYFCIIPTKNAFLQEECGAITADYNKLIAYMRERTENFTYIDIRDTLCLEDYYKTDTHWRQEKLIPAAEKIVGAMGGTLDTVFRQKKASDTFSGVYRSQWGLPLPTETMYYLTNDVIEGCKVYDHENDPFNGVEISMYDANSVGGRDEYEFYLHGSKSFLRIKNEAAKTDRRLVLFRDSFGSSIAPLFAEAYSEITIVDIRYISSSMLLGKMIDFTDADVLFLYSSMVLSQSGDTFK